MIFSKNESKFIDKVIERLKTGDFELVERRSNIAGATSFDVNLGDVTIVILDEGRRCNVGVKEGHKIIWLSESAARKIRRNIGLVSGQVESFFGRLIKKIT